MRNTLIELKAAGKILKYLAPIAFALWAAQQYIWLMWAAFGN